MRLGPGRWIEGELDDSLIDLAGMARPRSSAGPVWTTRRILAWTTRYFERKGIDRPRLIAEILLAHVLGCGRLDLYMDPDRPASELERATLRELIGRAGRYEPVDYLVGWAPFWSMRFKVTRDVLIPRPSTEAVVEHVLQHARRTPGFYGATIADVCTGSGVIAVTLAKCLPDSRVVATDVSGAALAVAKENAAAQGVADRVELRRGDLLEPLGGERFSYLVSNPPYVSDEEWEELPAHIKNFEPAGALRGGADGLDFLRPLIERGHEHLTGAGQLVLEIPDRKKEAVLDLARGNPGLAHARVLSDHEGLPRVLVAEAARQT